MYGTYSQMQATTLKNQSTIFMFKTTPIISIWYRHQGKHSVTFCHKFNAVKEGYVEIQNWSSIPRTTDTRRLNP